MRRELLTLTMGAALSLALMGCSTGTAPSVTPAPTPAVTSNPAPTDRVDEPGTANNNFENGVNGVNGGNGQVKPSTPPEGSVTRGVGNAVRNGVNDVRRGVDDMIY